MHFSFDFVWYTIHLENRGGELGVCVCVCVGGGVASQTKCVKACVHFYEIFISHQLIVL